MSTFYNDDNDNCCCRVVILNILKHIFIDNVMKIIKKYEQLVLTFLPHSSTQYIKDKNLPTILNNSDVNRFFGWTITKLKAKYLTIKDHSALHKVSIGKLVLLDNISVHIIDVLHDEHYLRMYYPLDDAILNKGLLTLCIPHYLKQFSELLTNARKSITTVNQNDNTIISSKDGVKIQTVVEFDGDFEELIIIIYSTSNTRVIDINLTTDE